MHHLRRVTDESVGLIVSVLLVIALFNQWEGIEIVLASFLVVFFLFRLSLGKDHIRKISKKRR